MNTVSTYNVIQFVDSKIIMVHEINKYTKNVDKTFTRIWLLVLSKNLSYSGTDLNQTDFNLFEIKRVRPYNLEQLLKNKRTKYPLLKQSETNSVFCCL